MATLLITSNVDDSKFISPIDPEGEKFKEVPPEPKDKISLAMRAYAAGASFTIVALHHWFAAEHACEEFMGNRDPSQYPLLVTIQYGKERLLEDLLLQIRRLNDHDLGSLGGATIAQCLRDDTIRSAALARSESSESPTMKEIYLDLVREICEEMQIPSEKKVKELKPEQRSMYLIRRAANKRAAHPTFSHYEFTKPDLYKVAKTTMMVARSIQLAMGTHSVETDYDNLDIAAYSESERIYGVAHPYGLLFEEIDSAVRHRAIQAYHRSLNTEHG